MIWKGVDKIMLMSYYMHFYAFSLSCLFPFAYLEVVLIGNLIIDHSNSFAIAVREQFTETLVGEVS